MLVLSRRAGESIVIGDDVVVTVLEVRGDVVRIGVDAPRSVRVHREEVYRELQAANEAAARAASADAVDTIAALVRRSTRDRLPENSPGERAPLDPGGREDA
ncbi:MAG: carbon storage regulator CsrA [Motilibacteraceae bacterium]